MCSELADNRAVAKRFKVALQHEREWLAQQLKVVFTDEERERLFEESWQITQMKERKKALSLRLWDPLVRHFVLLGGTCSIRVCRQR